MLQQIDKPSRPVTWNRKSGSPLVHSVQQNEMDMPLFGTRGILDAMVIRETDPEVPVRLSHKHGPSQMHRDLRVELEHRISGLCGVLVAQLRICNSGVEEQRLVAGFETGLRPSRAISKEQLYFPLTALGACNHPAQAQLGHGMAIESLRIRPDPVERIAAHYLEPLGSEPDVLTTKNPLLVPLITQLGPDDDTGISLFASPERPWSFIREGSELGESLWRVQTRVELAPNEEITLEVFLSVHTSDPSGAWQHFHDLAAPPNPLEVEWLRDVRVHYFDYLSPELPNGPRGSGYLADARHFKEFGVGLASQHGYYPFWGDYIRPGRDSWKAMPSDIHGGVDMSIDEMRHRIQLTRETGARPSIYIHLAGLDDASPLWPHLSGSCRIESDGSQIPFCWRGPDVAGVSRFMSISNPLWRDHLLQQAEWIFAILDPDAIVVDETFAGIGYDYAEGHTRLASAAAIDFFKKLREIARSFGPEKTILTSDCGLSGFVLWADGEAGDHAYHTMLGDPEYRKEPVRYLSALGRKPWLPCAWLWQQFWEDQLDLSRKTTAGVGVANGWLDYAGLAALGPSARARYLADLAAVLRP